MRPVESAEAIAKVSVATKWLALISAISFAGVSAASAADLDGEPLTPLQAEISSILQQDPKVRRVRWNVTVVGIWMVIAEAEKREPARRFAEAACKSAIANGLQSVGGKSVLSFAIFDEGLRNASGGHENRVLLFHRCHLDGIQE